MSLAYRGSSAKLQQILLAGLICFGTAHLTTLSAQDLKPLSSSLAARISSSGRKTVAVVDFTDLDGKVTKLGRFLAEEVSVDLVESTKGFEVIDRTHLKVILEEHRLSATGLIDPETARKLGRIAGADSLVTGTITPLGDTIRLSVKVLDTETARMIAASSTDIPRTPAVVALMNEEGVVSPTSTSPAGSAPAQNSSRPIPATVSVQAKNFEFGIRGCWRSGSSLFCSGFVSNKGDRRRVVGFSGTYVVDDLGNQYMIQNKFAFGASGAQQELEPDLPVNVSFSIEDLNPAATRATVVMAGYIQGEDNFKVPLRNIAIQKK